MALGPFYTGQVPGNPLVITVKDQTTDTAKSLESYSGAELRLTGPDGLGISTTLNGGSASLLNPTNGTVRYDWPSVTLFESEGDYTLQLKLIGSNSIADYTFTTTFEVYESLPDA